MVGDQTRNLLEAKLMLCQICYLDGQKKVVMISLLGSLNYLRKNNCSSPTRKAEYIKNIENSPEF